MMQNEINIDLKSKKYKMENAELNYQMNERRKNGQKMSFKKVKSVTPDMQPIQINNKQFHKGEN